MPAAFVRAQQQRALSSLSDQELAVLGIRRADLPTYTIDAGERLPRIAPPQEAADAAPRAPANADDHHAARRPAA